MKAAKTGHSLLKRKSDAIKMKLQEVLGMIKKIKRAVGSGMATAGEAHTEAVWTAGSFNHKVAEAVESASFKVVADLINVAGVKIPRFARAQHDANSSQAVLVGLSKGGEQVHQCREAYVDVLNNLVELATLQTSLQSLDDALRVTNRRVNALEFVIIPKLENTISYVISELDEMEREDTYRIKKVKDVRAKEIEEQEAKENALREKLEAEGLAAATSQIDTLLGGDPTENDVIDDMFA